MFVPGTVLGTLGGSSLATPWWLGATVIRSLPLLRVRQRSAARQAMARRPCLRAHLAATSCAFPRWLASPPALVCRRRRTPVARAQLTQARQEHRHAAAKCAPSQLRPAGLAIGAAKFVIATADLARAGRALGRTKCARAATSPRAQRRGPRDGAEDDVLRWPQWRDPPRLLGARMAYGSLPHCRPNPAASHGGPSCHTFALRSFSAVVCSGRRVAMPRRRRAGNPSRPARRRPRS